MRRVTARETVQRAADGEIAVGEAAVNGLMRAIEHRVLPCQ